VVVQVQGGMLFVSYCRKEGEQDAVRRWVVTGEVEKGNENKTPTAKGGETVRGDQ